MIADLSTLKEVLEKLLNEEVIDWHHPTLQYEELISMVDNTLKELDVNLSSRVTTIHPTRGI